MQKFFANAIVFIATGALSLSPFALSLQARSEQTRKSCETAIADGTSRIENGREITVTTDITDRSKTYQDPPSGRSLFVGIILDGNSADSVMLSPVFQKAIASEIINACGSVGAVMFGRLQTDWSLTYGIMSDGTIKAFECIDPDPDGNNPRWGQQVCV